MITAEQLVAFGTPIAVAVLAIIQKLESRKAEIDRAKAELERAQQKLATEQAERHIKERLAEQDVAALTAAEEVKNKLELASADTLLRLEVIRIEGNSKMGAQKKATWEALRELAKITKDPLHESKARVAEKIYQDHIEAEQLADDRVRLFVESERLRLLRLT